MDNFSFEDELYPIEQREFSSLDKAINHAHFLGCNIHNPITNEIIYKNPELEKLRGIPAY